MQRRPSHSELRGKILKARENISAQDWLAADVAKLFPEFEELGLWTEEEQTFALEEATHEIDPEHYVGQHPPQKSYEEICRNAELFAFAWDSKFFKRRMYLKFCFVKETFYIVSFHLDRSSKKEGR